MFCWIRCYILLLGGRKFIFSYRMVSIVFVKMWFVVKKFVNGNYKDVMLGYFVRNLENFFFFSVYRKIFFFVVSCDFRFFGILRGFLCVC